MAFSLVEVMVCVATFALITAGVVYGFTQADRNAEWSSMALAAQSIASEGLERARSATWETESTSTTADDFPIMPTNFIALHTMEIPASGTNFTVTNYISITNVLINPPLRQIIAKCVWKFPLTGKWFTNTVVTQRASN